MTNVLVAYASKRGSTAEVAEAIAETLRHSGFTSDVASLDQLRDRLLTFSDHYRQIARPFEWTFTRHDLNHVLAKIADREPDVRLAA